MHFSGTGYLLFDVIGGLLLLAVIVWAVLYNRRARGLARTERATRNLYRDVDREDKAAGRQG